MQGHTVGNIARFGTESTNAHYANKSLMLKDPHGEFILPRAVQRVFRAEAYPRIQA